MKAPKEGSRKREVWEAFRADGAEVAIALGTGKGLALGSVRSWLAEWQRDSSPDAAPPPRKEKPDPLGRERMQLYGRPVTVLNEGQQQSEIRFLDEGGGTRFVPNDWLEPARVRSTRNRME